MTVRVESDQDVLTERDPRRTCFGAYGFYSRLWVGEAFSISFGFGRYDIWKGRRYLMFVNKRDTVEAILADSRHDCRIEWGDDE